MATPTWQQILLRGQQTAAVWQLHAPTFKVRQLTLAEHQTALATLAPAAQLMEEAQDAVDDARAARDGVQAEVSSMNTRLPRKLDGDLMPDDPFHGDLEDIRRVASRSSAHIVTRGQKVVSLWKKLNARNAAATPVIAPLSVGGVTLATFQAQVESLPGLQQAVEDGDSPLRERRGELRTLAGQVDENNKRWYAGWQGEFLAGTPEGDALGQITTEGGGNGEGGGGEPAPLPELPGLAMLDTATVSGEGDVVLAGMVAEGAVTFDAQQKSGPDAIDFTDLVAGLAGPTATLTGLFGPGDHEVRVAGRNAAGLGEWSDPRNFTIPEPE